MQVHRNISDHYVESKPVMTLEKKYNIISSNQKLLIEKITALEQNYQEVASFNECLLFQILQSREREHKIKELVILFADRIKDVPAFLELFSKKKEEFKIVKPIPIPIHQQFRL